MAAVENPYVQDLSASYGPMLAGAALSCALWGMSCMQLFMYASNHGDDPLRLKILVYSVWALDTAAEALTMAGFWPPLIQRWGSLEELGTLRETNIHRTWVVCIVTFVVQCFYFWRIYRLAGKRFLWTGIFLGPMILWQLVLAPMYVKWCLDDLSFDTLLSSRIQGLTISLRITTAIVDITIMCFMTYLLVHYQNSEFRRTRKMLDRLVIITVNTGVWTALLAIIDMTLLFVYPTGIQFTVVEFPLGPLYVNAFLANLNARTYVRNELPTHNSVALDTGTDTWAVREGSVHTSTKVSSRPQTRGLRFATPSELNTSISRDSIRVDKAPSITGVSE